MRRPFFSVCMETYNRGKTIFEALRSVQNQTFRDFEVIVVDNRSADNTVEEIKRFFQSNQYKEYPFEYIFKQNKERLGSIGNWNEPLKSAKGRYIAVLEGDDEFLPTHLEEDGYDILLLDIKEPEKEGDFIGEFFKCDISRKDEVEKLKDHLTSIQTEIHGLINNASCQPQGFTNELEDYSVDSYRKVLEVNLVGSFLLTKIAVPFMKRQKSGSIVNIGSIQGVVAPTFEIYEGMNITSPLVYSVAKAGMIHFCKWVAAKYGKWNIRCNAVSPGGLVDSQRGGSEFMKVYSAKTPLGRMVHSGEVAEVVRFLISDKSKYITGQNILIDGGWTIY